MVSGILVGELIGSHSGRICVWWWGWESLLRSRWGQEARVLGLVIEVGEPNPWLSCRGGSWGQIGTGVDLGLMGLGPEGGGCGDKPGLHCGTAFAT